MSKKANMTNFTVIHRDRHYLGGYKSSLVFHITKLKNRRLLCDIEFESNIKYFLPVANLQQDACKYVKLLTHNRYIFLSNYQRKEEGRHLQHLEFYRPLRMT